jgi:hypothetical protein
MESLRNIIENEDFIKRHRRSANTFVRKRCLTFRIMILLLINMLKGSIQDELDHFFKAVNHNESFERVVTKSAFSQARKNLDHLAFVELNNHLVRTFYNTFPVRTWKGFTLLAVDGSTIKVPKNPENVKHFGVWRTAAGPECPVARISQLFDVLNKITVAAVVAPKAEGERELAAEVFFDLRPMDLVLLDRGYPAFWLFKMILATGGQFCARISDKLWSQVKAFDQSGKMDDILTFEASWSSQKTCRELGLDTQPLKLRLVRVILESGESEILITSLLDQEGYPADCFGDLYHHRWPVEEDYNHMKHRLEIENFSGKSVLAVYQDFHAKVLTKNLAAVLAHSCQDQVDRESSDKKHKYQINFTQLLSKLKDTVVLILLREKIIPLIQNIMEIAARSIEPVRPGRKYPRVKQVAVSRLRISYKPIR